MVSTLSSNIVTGDLFDLLPTLPENFADAIITSPPYALQRQKQYGGISEAEYPEWTVSWMKQVRRILKDSGNVAIVIRPHVKDGVISDYLLHTRLALRADGWNEFDELIWIKPTAPPLGHIGRPRRSWESILWFGKSLKPFCDPLANGRSSNRIGLDSVKGMGDYLHDPAARPVQDGISRCRDYVEVSTNEAHKAKFNTHPAQFPVTLVEWLIRLLTPKRGMVIDPFMGSGTSAVAAIRENRGFWGCEINPEYIEITRRRMALIPPEDDIFNFAI